MQASMQHFKHAYHSFRPKLRVTLTFLECLESRITIENQYIDLYIKIGPH